MVPKTIKEVHLEAEMEAAAKKAETVKLLSVINKRGPFRSPTTHGEYQRAFVAPRFRVLMEDNRLGADVAQRRHEQAHASGEPKRFIRRTQRKFVHQLTHYRIINLTNSFRCLTGVKE